jgi:hypothetical protein
MNFGILVATTKTLHLPGAGLELCERLSLFAQEHATFNRQLQQPVMLEWKVCGCSLANDSTDTSTKHDRGFAKVANYNPQILANYKKPEKIWSKVNAEGCGAFWEKRQDKSHRRNVKAKSDNDRMLVHSG